MSRITVPLVTVSCLLAWGDAQSGTRPPKKYVVNLDLPEEERWTQVVLNHVEIVKDVQKVLRYGY